MHDAGHPRPGRHHGLGRRRPAGRASRYDEIVASAAARELVEGYVEELNEKLNRWETVKKFTILPRDLSIEDGELTPSLKVKRASSRPLRGRDRQDVRGLARRALTALVEL